VALENVSLRDAARTHGAWDRELEQAHAIQTHLLPRRAPLCPALDCAAATLSSEPVGGDYYDFVEHSSREFTLAVGDVAGKGVPAALLLASVQARLRSQILSAASPSALLHGLNQALVNLDQPEKFVGMLCARVEARRGQLVLANAGLTPPLVRRSRGGFEELTEGGTVLGVSRQATYPDRRVELRAGDLVLIYTDGLTEARQGQTQFGIERVREVVEAHAHRRAAQILEALIEAVREFAEPPLDDLTVVVLKQLTDPVRSRPAPRVKFRLATADSTS
jgi:sigma-B regulation protein RsbU (phosphoserine phosphatase)